ncbi:MAG: multicopper oxidase domain-containing protein [Myxococcales bacterium]
MFGDTMLVNGTAFPNAPVEPRRYRLRILNACQARFLNLQLYEDDGTGQPDFAKPGPDFLVIGTEGGFLARPVVVPSGRRLIVDVDADGNRSIRDLANPGGSLLTGPAERWDVLVDFKGKAGKKYVLFNDAPAPYPSGDVRNDHGPLYGSNGDTAVLMRFEVGPDSKQIPGDKPLWINPFITLAGNPAARIDRPLAGLNPKTPEKRLDWSFLPAAALPIPTRKDVSVRQLTLNEKFDSFGRLIQMLGTNVAGAPGDFAIPYAPDPSDPNFVTERAQQGATEVWQIVNLTGDTHPIHFHLVNVQVLSRQPFDVAAYLATPAGAAAQPTFLGPARGPDAVEARLEGDGQDEPR